MAARPSKLTNRIKDEISKVIRSGNYMETAASHVGISKNTLYEWLKRGAREKQRLESNSRAQIKKSEKPFVEFSDAVEKALADAEVRDVFLIGKAAETNWQAAAWRLERKFPKRWGRKEQVSADIQHSGEVVERNEQDISITHKIDEYAEVYAKIAERGAVESSNEGDNS